MLELSRASPTPVLLHTGRELECSRKGQVTTPTDEGVDNNAHLLRTELYDDQHWIGLLEGEVLQVARCYIPNTHTKCLPSVIDVSGSGRRLAAIT